MTVAPNRPRPTVAIPATLPERKAVCRAPLKLLSAAWAVRVLPSTDIIMPMYPAM